MGDVDLGDGEHELQRVPLRGGQECVLTNQRVIRRDADGTSDAVSIAEIRTIDTRSTTVGGGALARGQYYYVRICLTGKGSCPNLGHLPLPFDRLDHCRDLAAQIQEVARATAKAR